MNDLFAKISSYDLFNNLIPGAVFLFFLSAAGIYDLNVQSIVGHLVIYYFVGLVISRVGSILIEPLLKLSGMVKYDRYEDFIDASSKDSKILTLLESSNLYRTILALMLVCVIALSWGKVTSYLPFSPRVWGIILCVSVAGLFLLSYRKQNAFIRKRVNHQKNAS
ncbi:hypothetical protein GFL54_24890 [Rhizobium laguerreae]|uniref:hypothetical protein n=1 Tax=Rhizobium laguerreae TaxID=1076926 RepID=UPI00143F9667|nr:hypothetical protein [Rhizobium laguerreae]MBY3447449.1 hypothetical protein [Rhizobium laguerreae]NKM87475.1 hypothetical protein [Rhizobium laguerreae]